jgi:hypothetical protein
MAGPQWLAVSRNVQAQIIDRVESNLRALDSLLTDKVPVSRLKVDGGWYAVLRIPATRSDEDWAANLLTETGIFLHPGHFYDFPAGGYVIVSLLPPPKAFAESVSAFVSYISEQCALP